MARLSGLVLSGLFSLILGYSAHADIRAWNGTSGYWTNETKWGGTVPVAGDAVTFPTGVYTVVLDGSTPDLSSYTQNGGTLFFTNWSTCLSATDVLIQSGKLDHAVCNTNLYPGVTNRVYIKAGSFTLASNGWINVDARGFPGATNGNSWGQGPGGAYGIASGLAGGGGHGGLGGGASPGAIYDSTNEPSAPGSGGGTRGSEWAGAGGGVVRIEASGRVRLNGTVSANGAHGVNYSGGGAGGSIWISCETFDGTTGLVSTKGGKGKDYNGGSGGGGRIAVAYDPAAQLAAGLTVGVLFGAGSSTEATHTGSPAGLSGTLYFPDDQILLSRWLSGAVVCFDSSVTQLTATFPSMAFIGGGLVRYTVPARFTITDALSVTGNVSAYDGVMFATGSVLTVNGAMAVTNARVVFEGSTSKMRVDGSVSAYNGILIVSSNLSVGGAMRMAAGSALYAYSASNRPAIVQCSSNLTLITNSLLYVYAADTNVDFPDYGGLVTVSGAMQVVSNSWVYPGVWTNRNTNNTLGAVLFRVGSLTISSNAGFNANFAGYAGGYSNQWSTNAFYGHGPGGGLFRPNQAGGGGYGGTGGIIYATGHYGKPYGSATNANVHGSGGGLSGDVRRWPGPAGSGGGAIWIQALGDVTMNGTMKADGGVPAVIYNGAGSGGGILVQAAGKFTGDSGALLSAAGGPLITAYNNGGGGGGRIAIWRKMPADLRDALYLGAAARDRYVVATSCVDFAGGIAVDGGTGSVMGTKGTALFITGLSPKGTVLFIR